MSGHQPARTWLIAASILGIVAALATFVVMITVRYPDGLEARLRTDLTSGASALRAARSPAAFKSVIGSLAAAGISVDLAGITGKGGTLQTTPGGALLTVHELIPIGGRDVPATLTGSRAGIDRQVRSLEITEAIGGVIALALLAALARSCCSLAPSRRRARLRRRCECSWPTLHTSSAHPSPRCRRPPSGSCEISRRARREPVDLADLVSAAMTATRITDPAARVEVVSAGPVPATGDREALLRAVRNLLDNAVAVANTVVVEVTQAANGPPISMSDNGPGVPADHHERIFEPFVRLPRGPRNGTGLGLAIVRRTIESHGGTVTCDPCPTGGARFTLRVPADS